MMMSAARPRVVIFGKGKWGSALGKCFSQNCEVRYIDVDDSREVFKGELVVLSTPFRVVHPILNELKGRKDLSGVINASKGIDRDSLETFSSLAKKYLKVPYGTLSGPTFAKELSAMKPTACVLAATDKKWVKKFSKILSTPYFRVYEHHDPRGVEVCAAVKNVLAIGAGISDGLDLGYNARAALLTRGSVEMMKLVKALGGKPSTVFGLAGLGDLWLTATGELSRNRQLGFHLATGKSASEFLETVGETVEGLYTVEQVEKLRKKKKLDLPICEQIYRVTIKGESARFAIEKLMTRASKVEESSSMKLK